MSRKNGVAIIPQRSAGPVDKALGLKIRTARHEAELSQAELGKKLGVTFQQVQKYEKGTNRVGPARLAALCQVLGRPITYFIAEPDYKPNTRGERIASFVASRVGHQLCEAAMDMSPPIQQSLVEFARSLTRQAA
jgi:transcriptional regulator with XRE-family HTH domain